MIFLKYIGSLILCKTAYWCFVILISKPSRRFFSLLNKKRVVGIIFSPLGPVLDSLVHAGVIAFLSIHFAHQASHPLLYLIIGGITTFRVTTLFGENFLFAFCVSLFFYFIFITSRPFVGENVMNISGIIVGIILGLLFLVLIGFLIFSLENWIRKRSFLNKPRSPKVFHKLRKRQRLIWADIISLILILWGSFALLGFLFALALKMETGIRVDSGSWGILYLICGIGLLMRKFWALRLTRVCFIFSIVIQLPLYIMVGSPEGTEIGIRVIVGLLSLLWLGLPLWYLFRKSVEAQFHEIPNGQDETPNCRQLARKLKENKTYQDEQS